jgi:hypothetical protein
MQYVMRSYVKQIQGRELMTNKHCKASIFALIICFSLFGCKQPNENNDAIPANRCDFIINDGSSSNTLSWDASASSIGFLLSNCYFNIFKAVNASDSGGTFKNYLFVYIADNIPGTYTNRDNKTQISYYNPDGNLYFAWNTDSNTYARIIISEWSETKIVGTIEGVLMSYPSNEYITISGIFYSFDSSKGVSISKENRDEYV